MYNEEAAEFIRKHLIEDDTKWKVMCLAFRALQKQIPKKPLQACGHATERWMNYCPICGQRIDWEGEEDEAYRCGCADSGNKRSH